MQKAEHDEGLAAGDVVIIGVDPHKASVTLEARDTREILRASGTFPTTAAGYRAMMQFARQWPRRVWAVEGARGVGRAQALRTRNRAHHAAVCCSGAGWPVTLG